MSSASVSLEIAFPSRDDAGGLASGIADNPAGFGSAVVQGLRDPAVNPNASYAFLLAEVVVDTSKTEAAAALSAAREISALMSAQQGECGCAETAAGGGGGGSGGGSSSTDPALLGAVCGLAGALGGALITLCLAYSGALRRGESWRWRRMCAALPGLPQGKAAAAAMLLKAAGKVDLAKAKTVAPPMTTKAHAASASSSSLSSSSTVHKLLAREQVLGATRAAATGSPLLPSFQHANPLLVMSVNAPHAQAHPAAAGDDAAPGGERFRAGRAQFSPNAVSGGR